MLLRAVLSIANESLRKRLRVALSSRDLLVESSRRSARETTWESLVRRSGELFVIDGSVIPDPIDRSLATLHSLPEAPEVIVVTEDEDPGASARLLAAGAVASVFAHLPEDLLIGALEGALDRLRGRATRAARAGASESQPRLDDFISESSAMRAFLATVRRVASSDSTLLITGETGVGKEHLARAIHAESPRAGGPFVAVNCGAIAETLLESELFGHQEGAFTGASRARRGWFELAHRGTVLLDEIGEMPQHLQVKLLRVIQDREVYRVGGETPISIDVRVMASTNRNLEAEIEIGRFRRDLFYRLGVVQLEIPPLRERREDIPALVEGYIGHFQRRFATTVVSIDPEALQLIIDYPWPGNVRELINVIERAMLLSDVRISPGDLPLSNPEPRATASRAGESEIPTEFALPLPEARRIALERFERGYLGSLLEKTHGRIGEAAEIAGITPRSLFERLRGYGIRKEDYMPPRGPRLRSGPGRPLRTS